MVILNVAARDALVQCGGIVAAQVRRIVEHFAYDAAAGTAAVSRTPLLCAGLHLSCATAGVPAPTTPTARCRRTSAVDRQPSFV